METIYMGGWLTALIWEMLFLSLLTLYLMGGKRPLANARRWRGWLRGFCKFVHGCSLYATGFLLLCLANLLGSVLVGEKPDWSALNIEEITDDTGSRGKDI
jgi:hypothetical protein